MIKRVWNVLLKLRCGVSIVDLVLSTARNAGFIAIQKEIFFILQCGRCYSCYNSVMLQLIR